MGTHEEQAVDRGTSGAEQTVDANEVLLRGRVSADPVVTVLPSGDEIVTVRVVVGRPARARRRSPSGRSRVAVDTLDCVGWTARARRSMGRLVADDRVEVTGAMRRRFYRAAGGAALSRVDVEVVQCRRVAPAGPVNAARRRRGAPTDA